MHKLALFAMAMALCAGASAQQYRWVDRDGRVQYGDTPPPGVKAMPLRAPAGGGAPAPAGEAADPKAAKGPLSPAEQEAAFRKRQIDAQKEREKQEQASRDAAAKKENCASAQYNLRLLESGQRISRVDAKGERYYLEDAQIAQEAAKARQQVQQACS